MDNDQKTKEWAAQEFDISPEEVLWHHSGICYSRIGVTTKEAADKVSEKVKGQTANGGMFDGMSLGGQTHVTREEPHYYDVTC